MADFSRPPRTSLSQDPRQRSPALLLVAAGREEHRCRGDPGCVRAIRPHPHQLSWLVAIGRRVAQWEEGRPAEHPLRLTLSGSGRPLSRSASTSSLARFTPGDLLRSPPGTRCSVLACRPHRQARPSQRSPNETLRSLSPSPIGLSAPCCKQCFPTSSADEPRSRWAETQWAVLQLCAHGQPPPRPAHGGHRRRAPRAGTRPTGRQRHRGHGPNNPTTTHENS